jgi:chemotaxis protein MotB
MKAKLACGLVLAALAASGCVSQGKYDQAVAQTQTTRAELMRKSTALDQANMELQRQQNEINALEAQFENANKSTLLQGATKQAQLSDLQKRLDDLRAAHAAAEGRAVMFRELAKKLQHEVDAGNLTIVLRDQRMVLQLPNDVLFDTGKTELKPAGKSALAAITNALNSMPGRHFQVAGHTDNVPIANAQFPSNWELSSGRALRVVHFMLEKGATPSALSAAGYADVDPVSSNESPEGRKHNRRTEITIQPNIDELVKVP